MAYSLSHQELISIAGEFGTPVYVYHAEKIKEQYEKLVAAFEGCNTRFFYASKALTNINIVRYIDSIGCSIDCSSINEVRIALEAGVAKENILYTSNGIDFSEIEAAAGYGVHINIDSLPNLEKFGKKYGHGYPVGIRLRPNIMAGGNLKISTGHDKSKFGIPVQQLEAIKKIVAEHRIFIRTLHLHTGSDISDADVFVKGFEVLFDLIPSFPELEVIDLGGGFKVPYVPGEKAIDLRVLARKVKQSFDDHQLAGNKSLQIWFEPGKFLVSECGYLITKVNVIKDNSDQVFAGVNSGLNHLIRPMMYDAFHYIENISNPGGPLKRYNVTGYICETDNFATDRSLPEIREGDLLVLYNAGAYGFEMASNYNSRYRPAEVMVREGRARLIRKADSFDDLLRNQVLLP
ncbi:MAG: diaminopimelate decarboxylase [Terrimonas sp.]|nr:diaminopimelate decarboxylase [Terrimonas sp.]